MHNIFYTIQCRRIIKGCSALHQINTCNSYEDNHLREELVVELGFTNLIPEMIK